MFLFALVLYQAANGANRAHPPRSTYWPELRDLSPGILVLYQIPSSLISSLR